MVWPGDHIAALTSLHLAAFLSFTARRALRLSDHRTNSGHHYPFEPGKVAVTSAETLPVLALGAWMSLMYPDCGSLQRPCSSIT